MHFEESEPAVEILSANKIYANGYQALLPVNLKIQEGEFITLLGPSGCGKSTLLKMIAGLLSPTDGRILLWRKPIDQLHETTRKMSFVFQSPTLMPWATVRKNVSLPLELSGVPKPMIAEKVSEALELVGLLKFQNELPRALSGGMQMRVSIARGLVTDPDLLLMDEPFGALDEITRHKLDEDLLALWAKKKLTVIFVTHSIHESVFLSNRVVMMAARPGQIVQEFNIDEPYPRRQSFMVSGNFMHYAQALQSCLQRASQTQGAQ